MVASDGVRAMMESALTARDRVGVQDFVLLENYTSEAAFIENLRKRFKENLIYVSGCGEEGGGVLLHITAPSVQVCHSSHNYIEYAYIGMKWRFSGKVCKNREHKKKDVKGNTMKPLKRRQVQC